MLKSDICINAKIILNTLFNEGMLSIKEICEMTTFKEVFVLLAIGWLASEDKVRFSIKNEMLYVELTEPYQELYY